MYPKAQLGCLGVLFVIAIVTAVVATSSLNPLSVYTDGGITSKIVVTLAAVGAVTIIVQLINFVVVCAYIRASTGKSWEDANCPGCGLSLLKYAMSHGYPMPCPKCKTMWHNGPVCYNKGGSEARLRFPKYPCPRCRAVAARDDDLMAGLQ